MYSAIETYRGVVYPWHIDHVGHMNIQFYTARFDEATWQFLSRLGLSPTHCRTSGQLPDFVAKCAERLRPDSGDRSIASAATS
jgi:acyl-CoA thioesterase FadM